MLSGRKHFCNFVSILPHTPALWWVLSPLGVIQGVDYAVCGGERAIVVRYGSNERFFGSKVARRMIHVLIDKWRYFGHAFYSYPGFCLCF